MFYQSSDLILIYPSKLNSYFFWWYQFNQKTLTFLFKNKIILYFSPSRELGTVQHKIELTVLKWLYRRFWRHVAKQYGFPEVKKTLLNYINWTIATWQKKLMFCIIFSSVIFQCCQPDDQLKKYWKMTQAKILQNTKVLSSKRRREFSKINKRLDNDLKRTNMLHMLHFFVFL